jgi:uncharacterized protein
MYVDKEKMERRCPAPVEVRVEESGKSTKIVGYASLFNVWADIGGMFKERVKPGAFTKTIKEADVRALWNHNPDYVLGRNKSGTLRLWEDEKGLGYEVEPPNTAWARDLIESIRRGDINQSSYGFMVNKQDINYENNERTIIDVALFDVSPVTYPAFPTTTAQVRSMFEKIQEVEPEVKEEEQEQPEKWAFLDKMVLKMKNGEDLSEEELRSLSELFNLSLPPAKHTDTEGPPPAKHAPSDTRSDKEEKPENKIKSLDKTQDLLQKAKVLKYK